MSEALVREGMSRHNAWPTAGVLVSELCNWSFESRHARAGEWMAHIAGEQAGAAGDGLAELRGHRLTCMIDWSVLR
jgi:hypothetical protein